jgi:hypothetical protein
MADSCKKHNGGWGPRGRDWPDEDAALRGPIRNTRHVKRVPRMERYNPNDPETWIYWILWM